MAREAEFKKQRVFNTGNGVAKPVWTNANRINHSNKFVPRSVELNSGRTNINSVRPKVNSVSPKVNVVSPKINTVRSRQPVLTKTSNSFSPKRPQVNPLNQRRHFTKSHLPMSRPIIRNTTRMTYSHVVKGNWGTTVKTLAVQTASGNDYLNLLIADSLLKTIWFINAPCYGNEALASPKANSIWSKRLLVNPLSADVCQTMLKMKLLDGKMNEDCYRLLKMMEKQAGIRK
ncbi:hypothetical protein Tco_0099478 [Tanacetum coccineum]